MDTAFTTDVIAAARAQGQQRELTLVEGTSFWLSDRDGECTAPAHGLFVRDTRLLSRWELRAGSESLQLLRVVGDQPFGCRIVSRPPSASSVIIERHRLVSDGMREDLMATNYGEAEAQLTLRLTVEADLADIFEVRGAPPRDRQVRSRVADHQLDFVLGTGDARGVAIIAPDAEITDSELSFQVTIPAGGSWTTTIQVLPIDAGVTADPVFPSDRPVEDSTPVVRLRDWYADAPEFDVDQPRLAEALAVSRRDIGSLRIPDPEHLDDEAVAAGAPWFMTLFGRDSLLTSTMVLPYFGELALGTLRCLARRQGTREDRQTEEQPGKILHEVRSGADLSLALGGASIYYGSIDSTPLFVSLVGAAHQRGLDVEELMPAVDRAMTWITDFGDRDNDGFVEYLRTSDHGLLHQGWKDSHDPISFSDGRLADGPIALAEVQGYAYAAYLARADLAATFGGDADGWRARAADLKQRFHQNFWLPEQGFYAIALDGEKRPVDTMSSNIGHCLASGIIDEPYAGRMVQRLLQPDMFTGFGIRTLSSDAPRFDPTSYHNGSVWPHDSVLVATGMARCGYRDEAARVTDGLLDAAAAFGGRLPELFSGFGRDVYPVPVVYPASCSPQAWAAAVPFQVLTLSS